MNEYIEREYLVDHIHACMENDRLMKTATKEEILQMVADAPSADVQPVVHGEWITKSTNGEMFDSCSVCGYVEWDEPKNYCPNCGAKMDGKGTDNVLDQ